MPTLSIVIPFHNNEKTIKKTIMSAFENAPYGTKLILVNNNSKDRSQEIIENLSKTIPEINIVFEKTPGVSAARNCGINYVKTEFFTFLDADDKILNDFYGQWNNFFNNQAHRKDDIIHFNFVQEFANGSKKINPYILPKGTYMGKEYLEKLLNAFKYETKHMVWSYIYRTDYIKQHCVHFDETLSMFEDIIFLQNLFNLNPTIQVYPKLGVKYCYHETSSTNKLNDDVAMAAIVKILQTFSQPSQEQENYFEQLSAKVLSKKGYQTLTQSNGLKWSSFEKHQRMLFLNRVKRKLGKA